MTAYEMVKTVFLLFLTLAMGVIIALGSRLANDLSSDSGIVAKNSENVATSLETALNGVQNIELNTTRTEAEMAGLLNATRHSMLTPVQVKTLVEHATDVMESASDATARLGAAADSLRGIAPTVEAAVTQLGADSHGTMAQGTAMLKAATDDLSDPAGKELLAHVDATAANVEGATADVKKIADNWAAPVKGFWNHLKILLFEAAGPLAQIATAAK